MAFILFIISRSLNQIIKCLNQIISENKPYNLRLCTFTLHKCQEKNLNPNRDSNRAGFESNPGSGSSFSFEMYVIFILYEKVIICQFPTFSNTCILN